MSQKPRNEPPRRKSLAQEFMIPGLIFAGAIAVAFLVLMFTGGASDAPSGPAAEENRVAAATMEKFASELDSRGIAEGPVDAAVVIREFADYQCPACALFEPTAAKLRETYADNDNVRFVFFAFPLRSHQHAQAAAEAAFCARERGKFWPFHGKLFEKQQAWSSAGDPRSVFMDIAVESGIELNPFRQCLEQGKTREAVAKSQNVAIQAGVVSTPTTLVGPTVFSGARPYEKIKAEIDRQLADSTRNDDS